jgi:hypothetical protein
MTQKYMRNPANRTDSPVPLNLTLNQVATLARALELGEGQIWRRDERRFRGRQRYVRIQFVCIGGERVRVQACKRDGTVPAGSRSTEVAVTRFGRRGGFLPTKQALSGRMSSTS